MVLVMTMSYRVVGFFRDIVLAAYLGNGIEADAYYVAFSTPNLIVNLISFGAVSSVMVPVFVSCLEMKDPNKVNRLYNRANTLFISVLVLLTLITIVGATLLMKLLAPGFGSEGLALSVKMVRIMLLSLVFLGSLGITTSVLHSYQNFFIPVASNLLFNLLLLFFSFLSVVKQNFMLLSYAFTISAVVQCIVQVGALRRIGIRYRPDFHIFRDPDMRLMARLMVPILVGSVITQLNTVIGRAFASGLSAGSVSSLNYANKLFMLPIGVIVGAVSTTVFPILSQLSRDEDIGLLREQVKKILRIVTLLILPIVVLFTCMSLPTVHLLFFRGAFSIENTFSTSSALFYYALGILPMALCEILSKVFYAKQNTKQPIIFSSLAFIVNVVLSAFLSRTLSHNGVALAFSISTWVNFFLLFVSLSRSLKLSIRLKSFLKVIVLVLPMALISIGGLLVYYYCFFSSTWFVRVVAFGTIGVFILAFYLISLNLLKVEELTNCFNLIKSRVEARKGK